MKLLEDKWALVTGSSRGIGQQIAIGLAQRKCNVIVHGRTIAHAKQTMELLQAYYYSAMLAIDSENNLKE